MTPQRSPDQGGDASAPPSRSRADKAGDRLKRFVRDEHALSEIDERHDLRADLEIVQGWRDQFGGPLAGAAMGLRSMVKTGGVDATPTQRHKRLDRIVQKLARPTTSRLSTLQDIAGVRAVVPDLDALRQLQAHIERTWCEDVAHTSGIVDPAATTDYVAHPRSTGYRAVHLIVRYNGLPVEVQLRTSTQQFWADLSERVSRDIDEELKAGGGPAPVTDFFVKLGERIGAIDEGDTTPFEIDVDLSPWGGQHLRVKSNP